MMADDSYRWVLPIQYKINTGGKNTFLFFFLVKLSKVLVPVDVVTSAIEVWQNETCVTFERNDNPTGDYINIINDTGAKVYIDSLYIQFSLLRMYLLCFQLLLRFIFVRQSKKFVFGS